MADGFPAVIKGQPTEAHELTFMGGKTLCSKLDFEGELAAPAESLSPALGKPTCTFGGEQTLQLNGCAFIFHPGAEKSPGVFGGTFDIGPPGCGPMTLAWGSCVVSFYPKTGLAATYENEGTGTKAVVRIKAQGTGIKYSRSGWCGTSSSEDGTYTGGWIAKAEQSGVPIGLRVAKKLPVGVYMTGKESAEKSQQPKLEAESYPVTMEGEAKAWTTWTMAGGSLHCNDAHYEASATASATNFPVAATYGDCEIWGLAGQVDMNSCHYVVHALNAGPPFQGKVDIACDEAGDAIEFNAYADETYEMLLCTAKVGPQTGLEGLDLKNVGAAHERGVTLGFSLKGLKYTINRYFFLCAGQEGKTYEDGTYSHETTLLGWR